MNNTDWRVPQGTTALRTFTYTNKLTGTPVNLTGAVIYFTAKENYKIPDTEALIKKEAEIIDAVNGKFKISLSKADTLKEIAKYMYDIIIDFNPESSDSVKMQLVPPSVFEITPTMRAS